MSRHFVSGCAIVLLSLVVARSDGQSAMGNNVSLPPPQQALDPGTLGSVTGTVTLSDTQRGARFALVMLTAVPVANGGNTNGLRGGFGGGGSRTKTDLDGTFTLTGVPPGDYFVLASAPGYMTERQLIQAQFDAGAQPADLAAKVPTVHVAAGGAATIQLSLERGGAISGHMQWEDGSPAAGVQMLYSAVVPSARMPAPLSSLLNMNSNGMEADDRGNFRLAGLPSGDYFVEAMVDPNNQFGVRGGNFTSPLHVYAPGVFRQADAKAFTVRAGDERSDIQIVLDLRSLHTVAGHVSSAAGQKILSGRVSLADSVDHGLNPGGSINASGDFSIPYIPKGTYTMTVQASTDAQRGFAGRGGGRGTTSSSGTSVTFQPFTQTLLVGDTDVTGMLVSLVPAK